MIIYKNARQAIDAVASGALDGFFARFYGGSEAVRDTQRARYIEAVRAFAEYFGEDRELSFFSAPGRTEIGGNHTDHNHGKVLAAAINLDVIAVAAKSAGNEVRIQSKGYKMDVVGLGSLEPVASENNKSNAMVRGMMAGFSKNELQIGGFDAYTTSNVLKGSGLSSSAAYEVLIGTILNHFYNGGTVSDVLVAQLAQFAENVYFGKASGLLDQLTSSVGGFIAVDFFDPAVPAIEKVAYDFTKSGYDLCIVDTKGSHSDLSDEYSLIPAEMKQIAGHYGMQTLSQVDQKAFYRDIAALRKKCGDRAVLRAIHFFEENKRVEKEARALETGDFSAFLQLISASGNSSYRYLQNVFAPEDLHNQGLSLALCLAEQLLAGKGACRVHGGGFAGTIQAFVPHELTGDFTKTMENVFGEKCCYILSVRPEGGVCVC